jgi:hypothetical protein
MVRALAVALLLLPALDACAAPASSAPQERPMELVVTLAPGAEGLEGRLREEDFFRWMAPRLEAWRVTVRSATDEPAPVGEADATLLVVSLPASEASWDLLRGLPVELTGARMAVAGTGYDAREVSLTVRSPEGGERWLVASADPEALVEAADRALARMTGGRFKGDDPNLRVDYEVRAGSWLQRTGTWRRHDGGWAPDPASEQDGLAERERWLDSLRPIDAGAVRLLVPPGREGSAEMRALAAELGRTAAAVAPRIPLDAEALSTRPVTVAVEADHVAQIRHTGSVGAVVPGWTSKPVLSGGSAEPPDLALVFDPDDVWAFRHAVARHLLERASAGSPPLLVDGAALWLTGAAPDRSAALWYGRPYREWLPDLAAAEVLPEPRDLGLGAELEQEDRHGGGDASEPLWTPIAAAVMEGLPGRTAVEKLAAAGEGAVRTQLAAIAGRYAPAPAPVPAAAPRPAPLPAGPLRGVSLAASLTLEGAYHAPGLAERLDRLAGLGANAVSLMPFASQRSPDSTELRFLRGSPTSETDTGLVHAARAAHRHGFTVLWKPHLWVGHDSWPGEIAMTSEADWRAWWHGYRRYVLHHALLARYAGAEVFCVGVELERTVERRADWLALIAAVRRVFPGALTYAANWGSGADRVAFWDALDAAGVDAYYPLAESADVGERELRRGAAEVARRLEAVARRSGKPLLLTEVGFPAQQGAWLHPHQEGGELSVEDQAAAYRALLGQLEGRPWLRGVFVWKAFSGDEPFRAGRSDFRFLDRPSEQVVAAYFQRLAQGGGAAPGRP